MDSVLLAGRERRSQSWAALAPVSLAALIAVLLGACSAAATLPGSAVATASGAAVKATSGMVAENVQVEYYSLTGPISIAADITNVTGRDDALVGASSPAARTAGLFATSGCMPEPSPTAGSCGSAAPGIPAGKIPMNFWGITSNATIHLRSGAGEILLIDLVDPVVSGQSIDVTFKFQNSPPLTVQVQIP
jgi:copper(I)-binding protein